MSVPLVLVRRFVLVLSVGFVAFAVAKGWPEVRNSASAVRELHPGLVALALLLAVAAVACLPQVYRASVEAFGHTLRYRQALQVSMGAFTLSRVLPGGGAAGGVFAARRLTQMGVPAPVAATAVVLEGVLSMVTLGLVVVLLTAGAALRGTVGGMYVAVAAVAVVLFALVLVVGHLAVTRPAVRERVLDLVDRVLGRHVDVTGWRRAADDMADSMPGGRALAPIVGWSAVNWLLDIAALWLVFLGFGHPLPVGVLVLGFAVANLLTALPHTPGGLGFVEVGMTATYIAFDVPASVAIVAVLVYRLFAYWLPVGAGVPQYLRAPDTARDVEVAVP